MEVEDPWSIRYRILTFELNAKKIRDNQLIILTTVMIRTLLLIDGITSVLCLFTKNKTSSKYNAVNTDIDIILALILKST